jgi:hypothetical protein
MITKSIGYQTRLDESDSTLVQSGSFGGSIDQSTVDRLVNNNFDVAVRPSGRCVLVDRQGRQVQLYLRVDPSKTVKGKAVYAAWREQECKRLAAETANEEHLREELDTMIDLIGLAGVLAKLKEVQK